MDDFDDRPPPFVEAIETLRKMAPKEESTPNLPTISWPEQKELASDCDIEDVIENDVKIFDYMFKQLKGYWDQVNNSDAACRLALTTMKMIEQRRKALLLPFEATKEKDKSKPKWGPGQDDEDEGHTYQ